MKKKYQRKREHRERQQELQESEKKLEKETKKEEVAKEKQSLKNKLSQSLEKKSKTSKNTSKNKSEKKRFDLRKLDAISWFFIVATTSILGLLLFLSFQMFEKATEEVVGYDYYNEDLNFSLWIPEEWQTVGLEDDLIDRVVKEATGGLVFDMRLFSLKEEVVPVTLIEPTVEGDKKPFEKFMTMAYTGSDQLYRALDERPKLKAEFEALLDSLGHKDIEVGEAEEIVNELMVGVIMKATAELEGSEVSYYQYLEPAGANILKITYGNAKGDKEEKQIEDLENILQSLMYHTGGKEPIEPSQADVDNGDDDEQNKENEETETSDEDSNKDVNVNIDEEQTTEGIEIEELE